MKIDIGLGRSTSLIDVLSEFHVRLCASVRILVQAVVSSLDGNTSSNTFSWFSKPGLNNALHQQNYYVTGLVCSC